MGTTEIELLQKELKRITAQKDNLAAALREIAQAKPRLMHDENQHEVLVYSRRNNPCEIARVALMKDGECHG